MRLGKMLTAIFSCLPLLLSAPTLGQEGQQGPGVRCARLHTSTGAGG